eukprot:2299822-Rhodomonas_salina.1
MRKRSYLTKRTLQLGGRGQQTQRHVASGNLRGVIRAGGSQATTIEEGVLLEGLEAQRFALAGRTLDGPHVRCFALLLRCFAHVSAPSCSARRPACS